jgi:hypothetical protein
MDHHERSRSCRNKQISKPKRDPLDIICNWPGCNKSFAHERSLTRHVVNIHGTSPTPYTPKTRNEQLRSHAKAQERYWQRKIRRNKEIEQNITKQEQKDKIAMRIQRKLQLKGMKMQLKNKLAFDKMYRSLTSVSDSESNASSSE